MAVFFSKKIKIGNATFSLATTIWFLLATVAVLLEMSRGIGAINNYLIYKGVFNHTIAQKNLYLLYPAEYADRNHYGIIFSFLIAPFATLPVFIGCFFWVIANAYVLWYAIKKLPLTIQQQQIVWVIGALEMMTAAHNVQFNIMLTGLTILSFVCTENKKNVWATFFIALGIYTKLFGVVGLLFFFFTKQKISFIGWFMFWMMVQFCLPMLISSPSFVLQTYQDWFDELVVKNKANIDTSIGVHMQDISALGMMRRIFNINNLPNIFVTMPAILLFVLPLLRVNQFKHLNFRLYYLALSLISIVIFSTSSESPSYVIAVSGAAIWFSLQTKPFANWAIVLLFFMMLLTCLSPTDLFPKSIRDKYIIAYSLKALPCFVLWLVILKDLIIKNFQPTTNNRLTKPTLS